MALSMVHLLRLGVRRLKSNPSSSLVILLTMGVSMGVTTAVFAIYRAVVAGAVPYPQSHRLFMLWQVHSDRSLEPERASYPNYQDWKTQSQTFEDMAGFGTTIATLTGEEEPMVLRVPVVTANLFAVLGVDPFLGRGFSPEDSTASQGKVVVVAAGLWRRRWAADPDLVGRAITVNGEPHTVVGVMPPGFAFPEWAEAWLLSEPDEYIRSARGTRWMQVVGRLRAQANERQARREMALLAERLAEEYPEANAGSTVLLSSLREHVVGGLHQSLVVLLVISGLVLLIACANVSNLLLARVAARRQEMWIEAALGAPRWRRAAPHLLDALLLSLGGGGAALLLAHLVIRLLIRFQPETLPRLEAAGVDRATLGFTAAVCVGAALVCGLAPALAGGARAGTLPSCRGVARMIRDPRFALVVAETALGLVVLTAAGLLVQSLVRLQATDPGFLPQRVLALRLSLPRATYPSERDKAQFYSEVVELVAALPGVVCAAATSDLGIGVPGPFKIEGEVPRPGLAGDQLRVHAVTPGFLRTLGIPLRSGRELSATDTDEAERVGLANESLARLAWPDARAIGHRIVYWDPTFGDHPPIEAVHRYEVVGTVGDARTWALDSAPGPVLYVPVDQSPRRSMTLLVRTSGDPLAQVATIRRAIGSIDPDLPISEVETMEQILARSAAPRRFFALLVTLFAIVALFLAATGLYGLLSHLVASSRREMAVRMAVGAAPSKVVRQVLGRASVLALAGLTLGTAASLAAGRLLAHLLFEVSPHDPITLLAAGALLVAVAFLSSYVPALRAARVDPAVTLRHE